MRYIPYEDCSKAYRSSEVASASIDRPADQANIAKPPLILGMFATAALAGAIALLGYGLHGVGSVQKDVAQIVGSATPQPGMLAPQPKARPLAPSRALMPNRTAG